MGNGRKSALEVTTESPRCSPRLEGSPTDATLRRLEKEFTLGCLSNDEEESVPRKNFSIVMCRRDNINIADPIKRT